MEDLTDRIGLKREWEQIDGDVRAETVTTWARLMDAEYMPAMERVRSERDAAREVARQLADSWNRSEDPPLSAVATALTYQTKP